MPRRITAAQLEDVDGPLRLPDFGGRPHLYFRKFAAPAPGRHVLVDMRSRALFIFLCPAEGPLDGDAALLRRICTGHGVGETAAAYLFTAEDGQAEDLPTDRGAVGPLADSALRAALRWVERPGRARLQSGLVILCHGQPWKPGTLKAQAMDDRVAALWSALRAFKRRPKVCGERMGTDERPLNPLKAPEGAHPGVSAVWTAPDGGPLPNLACTAWWVHPPR